VIAVVLFHAGVPGFDGGYIGVDVFFVISGYLITQLLAPAVDPSVRGWLPEFYIRRARRILPALFVTSMVVAVMAIVLLLPWDLRRFGQYLAGTAVLATNVVEWQDRIGYFRSSAVHSALGHFWSIAIEEQFYLLYPLVLMILVRYFTRYRSGALVALGAISLGACIWASYYRQNANYFLAPFRAWELLLGAALASPSFTLRLKSRLASELLGVLALAGLAAAAWLYTPETRYPGVDTLVPCAASAALIFSGREDTTLAKRLLSVRPLVFTGLISYSLYLWHFPVLILIQYYWIVPFDAPTLGIVLALIYGIAVLSWWLVERPIRSRTLLSSDRSFALAALLCSVSMLVVGMALVKAEGLPRRFPEETRVRDPPGQIEWLTRCVTLKSDQIARGELCSYGPAGDDIPRVLVWGDSHAMVLLPAYKQLALRHHLRIYLAATSTCQPILGLVDRMSNATGRARCADFNTAVVGAVRQLKPQLIILNAHWIETDRDPASPEYSASAPGASLFEYWLERTLRLTASNRGAVCVVEDVPAYRYDLPYAIAVARLRGMSTDFLRVSRTEALAQYREPERVFHRLEQQGMLRIVDPKDSLCRSDYCAFESGGELLYRDDNHLSVAGASSVATSLDACFRDFAPQTEQASEIRPAGTDELMMHVQRRATGE